MSNVRGRRGAWTAFTLVDLLTVIGIIALLLAVLVPVFSKVQARSRETVCTSNLHQIGQAVLMYAEEFDNRFPYGGDPEDVVLGTNGIPGGAGVGQLDPLPNVMASYIKDKHIWHCPSDIGFEMGDRSETTLFDTRPSSFDKYGSSYYYYTKLPLKHYPMSSLMAYSKVAPNAERGPSDIVVIYDGSGAWHGGMDFQTGRRASLFCDGHVKTLSRAEFTDAFNITFKKL